MLKNAFVFLLQQFQQFWLILLHISQKKQNENENSCNQNQEFYRTNVWFAQNSTHLFHTKLVFILREFFNCISVAYTPTKLNPSSLI